MKLNKEADDTRKKNCSRNTRKETKQLKKKTKRDKKTYVEKLQRVIQDHQTASREEQEH